MLVWTLRRWLAKYRLSECQATTPHIGFESLEPRVLLSVTALLEDGVLTVHGADEADIIELASADPGQVSVNGILFSDVQAIVVFAGAGNDTIIIGDHIRSSRNSKPVPIRVHGGEGDDTLDYSSATQRVVVNLLAGNAHGQSVGKQRVAGIETVVGSAHDDVLMGDKSDNVLVGGPGNDNLHGHHGDDTLVGGEGDDTLQGQQGNDTYVVGLGSDVYDDSQGNNVIVDETETDGGGGDDDGGGGTPPPDPDIDLYFTETTSSNGTRASAQDLGILSANTTMHLSGQADNFFDVDYYRFDSDAPGDLTVMLDGVSGGTAFVRIYDSAGVLLHEFSSPSAGAGATLSALPAGVYYLAALTNSGAAVQYDISVRRD